MKYLLIILATLIGMGCGENGASAPAEKKYRFDETISNSGQNRAYTVVLPSNYYDSSGFSLVIALHGGGGSSTQFEKLSQLTQKASSAKFIVVYPNGSGTIKTWNAGQCCGSAVTDKVDDVGFISKMIDKLNSTYKIDPKKVYVTGHSNGGMLAYRLACELSDKIAAIAPNASTMVITDCKPKRSVPIIQIGSKLDENVPYLGGFGSGVTQINFTPVEQVLAGWSVIDGCTNPKKLAFSNNLYAQYQWTGCNASRIDFYLTNDGGHSWSGGLQGEGIDADPPSNAVNANDLIWNFFLEYRLP